MSAANVLDPPSPQLNPVPKGEGAEPPSPDAPPATRAPRKRFRRRRPLRWLVAAGAIGFVLVRIWQGLAVVTPPESLSEGPHEVAEVIDGATLRLANGAVVRLMGVEPPFARRSDSQSAGAPSWDTDATELSRRFINGKPVRLVFDRERIDRQGRFLAYVEIDGRPLNEELLRAGLANVRLPPGHAVMKKRQLEKAEQEARKLHRGIWGEKAPAITGK